MVIIPNHSSKNNQEKLGVITSVCQADDWGSLASSTSTLVRWLWTIPTQFPSSLSVPGNPLRVCLAGHSDWQASDFRIAYYEISRWGDLNFGAHWHWGWDFVRYVILLKPMANMWNVWNIQENVLQSASWNTNTAKYHKIFHEIFFNNKCHQNNTKYFVKFFHKFFHKKCIIFHTICLVLFPNISHISRISNVCHMFHYITYITIFTMFHNVSQNILRKCSVIYCPLISPKWQHCRNFGLLPAMLAERIPNMPLPGAASPGETGGRSASAVVPSSVDLHWPETICTSLCKILRGSIRPAPNLGPCSQQYISGEG